MNDWRFYVYEHWRPDRDECFYVGKGVAHRAYQMKHGRNRYHRAITEKLLRLGMVVQVKIIASGLTDQEACQKEIDRISFWRNDGADLANMSSGGEKAAVGVKRSPEYIAALIERNKSRIVSAETRAKMSIVHKGNKSRTGQKSSRESVEKTAAKLRGIPRTEEVKAKLRAARIANPTFPKGCKHKPESVAKLTAGIKAAWARRKALAAEGKE